MKKIQLILALTLACFAGQTLFGQCTPDPNPTVPGFYPDTFPDGEVGMMYDAVMSAVLPKDTTVTLPVIQTITVSFCSFEIDTIFLPDGLTYQCDQPNCSWDIDHTLGVINRGCIRIMGTPTETVPDDSVEVVINIIPGYIDSMRNNLCNTDSLRDELGLFWPTVQALLAQSAKFKMSISPNTANTADLASTLELNLYPNPADTRSQIEFNLQEAKDINITLMDGMGRLVQPVYSGNAIGLQRHDIITGDLAPGLYLVRLEVEGEGQVVRKLTVQ